jgi:hypothetical protein
VFSKVTVAKLLLFSDYATYHDYVDQESSFRSFNTRDLYHEFNLSFHIEGFLPKILVVNSGLGGPGTGLAKSLWFWVFTLFGLTVPYRIWFSRHCSDVDVTLSKKVSRKLLEI